MLHIGYYAVIANMFGITLSPVLVAFVKNLPLKPKGLYQSTES